jgi:uncharacterized protein (TIGR03435 family)
MLRTQKTLLAVAANTAALFMVVTQALTLGAQTAAPKPAGEATPKFDVVSVKPCRPGGREAGRSGGGTSPGTLQLTCANVSSLIRLAYVDYANGRQSISFAPVPIEGGPSWTNSDRYEIDAKAEGAPGFAMLRGPMLQEVLEDRFKLKLHRDSRDVPVYALTVGKGGPKLQPSQEGSCVPLDFSFSIPHPQFCGQPKRGDSGLHLIGATLADLCIILSAPEISDRPTIDKTGIAGRFDIQLPGPGQLRGPVSPRPGFGEPAAPPAATDPLSDSFDAISAAVDKLGLKLERTRGPGTLIVIDHVEKPAAN